MDSLYTMQIHLAQAVDKTYFGIPTDLFNTFLSVFVAMIISLVLQSIETRKGLKQLRQDRELRDIVSKLNDYRDIYGRLSVIVNDIIDQESGSDDYFDELEFRLPLSLRETFAKEKIRSMGPGPQRDYFKNFKQILKNEIIELYKQKDKIINSD